MKMEATVKRTQQGLFSKLQWTYFIKTSHVQNH